MRSGSFGVVIAAAVIAFTGWLWLDPVVSVGIGCLVLPRAWEFFASPPTSSSRELRSKSI